jgi:putative sugar O-methyltransferase
MSLRYDFEGRTRAMADEVSKSPDLMPSAFWTDINAKNMAMIRADGLAAFKKTVSQNYFNWMITSADHPFFKHLSSCFRKHPRPGLFATWPERRISVRLTTSDTPITLSTRERWEYAYFVGLVWETMLKHDRLGLSKRITEPLIGSPILIRRGLKLISQDLANSILEFNTFHPFLREANGSGQRPVIGEIGAGYGRLAHVAMLAGAKRYVIFDLPPALAVAEYYLNSVFPQKKIFNFRAFERFEDVSDELHASDIVLATANQIKLFPDRWFDVLVSISTLPEMTYSQASFYLAEMCRLSSQLIFIKQWMNWTNDVDGTVLRPDDYSPREGWTPVLDQVDPITPDFFNRVWRQNQVA